MTRKDGYGPGGRTGEIVGDIVHFRRTFGWAVDAGRVHRDTDQLRRGADADFLTTYRANSRRYWAARREQRQRAVLALVLLQSVSPADTGVIVARHQVADGPPDTSPEVAVLTLDAPGAPHLIRVGF